MKTFEQIISQEPVYLNLWKSKFDVIADFEEIDLLEEECKADTCPPSLNEEYWLEQKEKYNKYSNINILFASYGCECYEGDAWVLFEQNGKLYEVSGSHCSCYGLEGQWQPEEVSLEELEHRLLKGTFGEGDYIGHIFKKELCDFLGVEYIKNIDNEDD